MLKYALALGVLVGFAGPAGDSAQEVGCLHGSSEPPAQLARRRAALSFTRQVNTAESTVSARNGHYAPLPELSDVPGAPDGFQAQLSTDGATYTFSVKDTLDSCHFAFFSDQMGLIYTAQPLQ